MVLGLLRLIESSGSIHLDGHSLFRVPRDIVRNQAFIMVPQEPFFLPDASLGLNLDPDSLASEAVLRAALEVVGVWDAVCEMSRGNGLDPLSQPFSLLQALSVGQMQLIAMARAVVKKRTMAQRIGYTDGEEGVASPKPVLVLDEATSSLDALTEAKMYDVIESEFTAAGCTVVVVAHRVSGLAKMMRPGRDRVAWLQDGRVLRVGDYREMALAGISSVEE
jgi:ABC-type multidrug transport system fused ATPase/permease subunit